MRSGALTPGPPDCTCAQRDVKPPPLGGRRPRGIRLLVEAEALQFKGCGGLPRPHRLNRLVGGLPLALRCPAPLHGRRVRLRMCSDTVADVQ